MPYPPPVKYSIQYIVEAVDVGSALRVVTTSGNFWAGESSRVITLYLDATRTYLAAISIHTSFEHVGKESKDTSSALMTQATLVGYSNSAYPEHVLPETVQQTA